jgi:rhodanese-related sulfurtransferase
MFKHSGTEFAEGFVIPAKARIQFHPSANSASQPLKLWLIRPLADLRWHIRMFPRRRDTRRCGDPGSNAPMRSVVIGLGCLAISFLLALAATAARAGHDDEYVDTIPAERVKQLLDVGEKILLVDLRPAGDFQKARLPGAISIPISELQKRHQEIPKSGRVILYCACPPGGVDESYSYLALQGKGYRNVSVLEDGFSGWAQRKFPVVSR